ncbi:hypothetical protein H9P43_004897 [Blastocladiella emersonii ATCC 22665]|nr:hypothetical protein H9P43_004897 [Blastocladiella emersonii ATCC 22665]
MHQFLHETTLHLTDPPPLQFTTCTVAASPGDSSVYVFGGKATEDTGHAYRLSNTLYRLHLANPTSTETLAWEAIRAPSDDTSTPWPSPRCFHATAYWPQTRELVVSCGFGIPADAATGRVAVPPPAAQMVSDIWAFQIDSRTWRRLPTAVDPLSDHTASIDTRRNFMYLVGGSSIAGDKFVLPSLVTAVDLRAQLPGASGNAAAAVAQVTPQYWPVSFRRRRHTAAMTCEGLAVVGGRDESFATQPAALFKVSPVAQSAARRLNHAGGRGIAVAAHPVPALDALAREWVPALGNGDRAEYAAAADHVRVFELPDPRFLGAVNFPDKGERTRVRVYDVMGAAEVAVEPLDLPGGVHAPAALGEGIAFVRSTFNAVALVNYSRFVVFPEAEDAIDVPVDPRVPADATIECANGELVGLDPRRCRYVAHLRDVFTPTSSGVAAHEEARTRRLVLPSDSASAVRATLAFAEHGDLRGVTAWPTLRGVYHLAHVWCAPRLVAACCRWVLARVADQGPADVFGNGDQGEEDAVVEMLGEANAAGEHGMQRVLAYAFRVWGVGVEEDE